MRSVWLTETAHTVERTITGELVRCDPCNKLAVALAARDAMRAYRTGKPVAFQQHRYPPRTRPAAPVNAWKEVT